MLLSDGYTNVTRASNTYGFLPSGTNYSILSAQYMLACGPGPEASSTKAQFAGKGLSLPYKAVHVLPFLVLALIFDIDQQCWGNLSLVILAFSSAA